MGARPPRRPEALAEAADRQGLRSHGRRHQPALKMHRGMAEMMKMMSSNQKRGPLQGLKNMFAWAVAACQAPSRSPRCSKDGRRQGAGGLPEMPKGLACRHRDWAAASCRASRALAASHPSPRHQSVRREEEIALSPASPAPGSSCGADDRRASKDASAGLDHPSRPALPGAIASG